MSPLIRSTLVAAAGLLLGACLPSEIPFSQVVDDPDRVEDLFPGLGVPEQSWMHIGVPSTDGAVVVSARIYRGLAGVHFLTDSFEDVPSAEDLTACVVLKSAIRHQNTSFERTLACNTEAGVVGASLNTGKTDFLPLTVQHDRILFLGARWDATASEAAKTLEEVVESLGDQLTVGTLVVYADGAAAPIRPLAESPQHEPPAPVEPRPSAVDPRTLPMAPRVQPQDPNIASEIRVPPPPDPAPPRQELLPRDQAGLRPPPSTEPEIEGPYADIKRAIIAKIDRHNRTLDALASGCDRLDAGTVFDALACVMTGGGMASGSAMGIRADDITVFGCTTLSATRQRCRWRASMASNMPNNPMMRLLLGVMSLETVESLFENRNGVWTFVSPAP
ncbi:MAG: hypothetical protein AAF913_00595 [Pseudomonadota bacterium]